MVDTYPTYPEQGWIHDRIQCIQKLYTEIHSYQQQQKCLQQHATWDVSNVESVREYTGWSSVCANGMDGVLVRAIRCAHNYTISHIGMTALMNWAR